MALAVVWLAGAAQAAVLNVPADHATIQAAVNAAATGDTIRIAAGTYTEQVVVDRPLLIEGSGNSATGTIVAGSGGTGFRIAASGVATNPVHLRNVRIRGFLDGVWTYGARELLLDGIAISNCTRYGWNPGNASNVVLRDSEICNTPYAIWIDGTNEVNGFTMERCSVLRCTIGLYSQASPGASNHFQNVLVRDCRFDDNSEKGLYLEKLHKARFESVTVDHSGWNASSAFAAGIDVNLKYRTDYSDLVFTNLRVLNCGVGALNGVGLTVKARDDAPSYAAVPAALSNVQIVACLFTNNEFGIRFGEVAKTNAGPANATLEFSTLLDSRRYGILNEMLADVRATNVWWGTTNDAAIAAAIYDRNDSAVKGLVGYAPASAGYALNVAITGCGAVSNTPPVARYGPMMIAGLRAWPCEDWRFAGWTNAATGNAVTTTVVVTGDTHVGARFRLRPGLVLGIR